MVLLLMKKDHHHTLTFITHKGEQSQFLKLCQIQKKTKKSISSTTGIFNKDIPHAAPMKRNNLNTKIMEQNKETSKTD